MAFGSTAPSGLVCHGQSWSWLVLTALSACMCACVCVREIRVGLFLCLARSLRRMC